MYFPNGQVAGCSRLQQVAVALTSWICLVWQIEVRVQHFCLQIQTRPQVSQLQAAPIRGGDGWRHESSAVKSPLKSVVFRCWFPFCLLALWQFRTPQACAELTDCVCLCVCCGKECPDPACWNRKSFCKTGASYRPTVVNMCFNPIPKERDSLRSRSKEGFHASWICLAICRSGMLDDPWCLMSYLPWCAQRSSFDLRVCVILRGRDTSLDD